MIHKLCVVKLYVVDIVSTNVTNAISTSVTSTGSINYDDKKVRYKMECYILYTVLLMIILLFTIAITCDHYTKHRSKLKNVNVLTIEIWKIMKKYEIYKLLMFT